MSLNDRCQEALDALQSGASINHPEVRQLVASVLQDGADGTHFPEGIHEAAHAIRHQPPTKPRVRLNADGTLDDFWATNVRSVHFEAMSENDWWVGIQLADGSVWSLNFGAVNPRAKGYARAELEEPSMGVIARAEAIAAYAARHACDPERCCRQCKRHVNPHRGCLLR